ncbi:UNVERIFIED_CONTAM: hypothetical protein GTU68_011935 [Idotea baltica]|nr:hypothetical protein [Idotea baltica]
MLAADVIGAHQVGGGDDIAFASVVVNGDFESSATQASNFYDADDVQGWNVRGGENQLNIFSYNGYDNVLDLDSTGTAFDEVYQTVAVEADATYLLSFDFRKNQGGSSDFSGSFDFEVLFDGEVVGSFTGKDLWLTGVVEVTGDASGTSEIAFREIADEGTTGDDGIGSLLDNVRLVRATEVAVTNGSFESATGTNSPANLHKPFEVDGWTGYNPSFEDRFINIQNSGASDGSRYLDLNVSNDRRDAVSNTITTTAGSQYYVTFDQQGDGDGDELRVRWNDAWAATLIGGEEWESRGIILDADSAETELLFLQGSSDSGSGPLIDNVRVFEISQPAELTVDANVNTDGTGDSTVYDRGKGALLIANSFGISGDDLSSVTVTLNGVVDGNNEVLGVSPTSIINDDINVSSFNQVTRQLTLTGQATAAEYQTVLRSLFYNNRANGDATTTLRQVVVSVTDVNNQTESALIQVPFETSQDNIDDALIQKFIFDNGLVGQAQPVQEGLFAVIDNEGSGQNPTINSTVRVAYSGYLLELNDQNQLVEGLNFDASEAEGVAFSLAAVIRGWTLGIPEFKTGGSGKLLIPSRLGYGEFGAGSDIPPNAVLVFDVELLEIVS